MSPERSRRSSLGLSVDLIPKQEMAQLATFAASDNEQLSEQVIMVEHGMLCFPLQLQWPVSGSQRSYWNSGESYAVS